MSAHTSFGCFARNCHLFSQCLTLLSEYGTNAQGQIGLQRGIRAPNSKEIPPGEERMDFDKDHFDEDNEMSPLEEDELGGDAEEIVETEEEEMVIAEEEPEEAAPARPAPKPGAKKPAAKKKPAKKKAAKKSAKKKKPAKKAKKSAAKKKKKKR